LTYRRDGAGTLFGLDLKERNFARIRAGVAS
jgi:hypothetical protein